MLKINIHFILKTITSMFSPVPWISLFSRAFSPLSCSPERNALMKEKILIMGEERRPVGGSRGPLCLFPADFRENDTDEPKFDFLNHPLTDG